MSFRKKIKVLDLFAGAGGFGLGFKLASDSYKLIGSLEIDKWAVNTLRANNSDKQRIIHSDIRKFRTAKQILSVCPEKPQVIIGGPPCQGFSNAGRVKDPKDPRNSLFKYFVKWVKVLGPEVFVMENVPGILTGRNEKGVSVIRIIQKSFQRIGYHVQIWELNAANYGVPQNRERVFIVGNKLGLSISPPPITHYLPSERKALNGKAKNLKKAVTVSRAICDLPKLDAGEGQEKTYFTTKPRSAYQKFSRRKATFLFNHVTMVHTKRVVARYEQILKGSKIDDLRDELQVRSRNGNGKISEVQYQQNYRHLKPDMVSYTIPASFYSNFVHPKQPRNITSREAARLQSFPDYYVFKGKRTQISAKLLHLLGRSDENYLSQYNQIGNAVPPLLSRAVGKQILFFLNKNRITVTGK